jgi:hypothetical protein
METGSIVPPQQGGDESISNAIPLCPECHAELRTYDEDHPRGRRYTAEELKQHKEQWIEICQSKPEALLSARRSRDVGPIQALVGELDFNLVACRRTGAALPPCRLRDEQLRRAIAEGALAVLVEDLRIVILEAYVAIGRYNQVLDEGRSIEPQKQTRDDDRLLQARRGAEQHIEAARQHLHR